MSFVHMIDMQAEYPFSMLPDMSGQLARYRRDLKTAAKKQFQQLMTILQRSVELSLPAFTAF